MRASSSSFVLCAVLCAAACPGGDGGRDGGAPGADGGPGAGGPPTPVDVRCAYDDECGDGTICDRASGDCVPGLDCTENAGLCAFCGDADVDCGFGVAVAFCDEGAGVCRRAKGTCEACLDDVECAPAASGLPSACLDGFCAAGCGPCPPGFSCRDGGCVPVENAGQCEGATLCGDGTTCPDGTTCSELGVCLVLCAHDEDCPADKICFRDIGPLEQLCVEKCPLGTTNGAGAVCHADGRFGDPCPTPDSSTGCPDGTVCNAAGVCVLAGCQSDQDCPLARTYCDLSTGECVEGCNGVDDCGAFEECVDGQCVAGGCRSADSSCELGQFCCGADLYATTACPAPVEDGACFLAPDPFCRPCESDDDCADIQAFGDASYCYELQDAEGQSLGKYCSVGCDARTDCPRGLPCRDDLPTPDGGTTQGCLDALCPALVQARGG